MLCPPRPPPLPQGASLPYMAPAYESYAGPRALAGGRSGGVSLLELARRHLRGEPPPRPFDQGLLRNVQTFFWEDKPCSYRWLRQPNSYTVACERLLEGLNVTTAVHV